MNLEGRKIWRESEAKINSAFSMVYKAKEKAKLEQAGYTVLRLRTTC